MIFLVHFYFLGRGGKRRGVSRAIKVCKVYGVIGDQQVRRSASILQLHSTFSLERERSEREKTQTDGS